MNNQHETKIVNHRLWKSVQWAILAVIIIGGFLFASYGYWHGLPIVDWEDEKTIWSMGRASFDPTWIMYQSNYPPGILAVSSAVQQLQIALGDPYINVAVTVQVMRLLSIVMFTVTVILIMILAYHLAGAPAAIAGALFWIVLPVANLQAKLALVNCWVSATFMAAVLAAGYAWIRASLRWWVIGFILAIVATLFKYQAAAVLVMVGLGCLRFWTSNRRKALAMMFVFIVVVGAFSYWLIVVHQALSQNLYLPDQKASMPTVTEVITNLVYTFTNLGPSQIFGLLPLAVMLWPLVLVPYRRLYKQAELWMYPIVILSFTVILSFNGAPVFDRHYMAAIALLSALAGAGFWLTIKAFDQLALRLRQPLIRPVAALILVGFLGFHENTMLQTTLRQDADFVRPDFRDALSMWAQATATEGPMIITNPQLAVSVQPLYGYRGRTIETPYNEGTFIAPKAITQAMIDSKNIRYIVTGNDYTGQGLTTPVTRLIVYADNQTYRGPGWAAYYVGKLPLYPLESDVSFGDQVELRGFGTVQSSACPGGPIDMQAVWSSVNTPRIDYSYYVHLFRESTGEISAPQNGAPPAGANRPTSSWLLPGELLVGPPTRVTLPADLKPGTYQVWLGIYDPMTGVRLKTTGGADHVVVGTLAVPDCRIF